MISCKTSAPRGGGGGAAEVLSVSPGRLFHGEGRPVAKESSEEGRGRRAGERTREVRTEPGELKESMEEGRMRPGITLRSPSSLRRVLKRCVAKSWISEAM
jgi:hypothetical protein